MPFSQSGIALAYSLTHEAHHLLVGIGTSLVDFQTAMTAFQALESDLHSLVTLLGISRLVFYRASDVNASSRANNHLTLILGVEVKEDVGSHLTSRQVVSAIHASLFVCGA